MEIKIMARTAPDKAELKRNIANIKKFLQQRDFGMIDSGIELADPLKGQWKIKRI